MSETLTLFDAKPRCAGGCGQALGKVRWEVMDSSGARIIVCPGCAHNYKRGRQLP